MRTIIRITDDSPRPDLERAMMALDHKRDRLPVYRWVTRRHIEHAIDELVAQWAKTPV